MDEYIEREALMAYAHQQPSGFISDISIQFFPAADVAPVRHARWKDRHMYINGGCIKRWDCTVCECPENRRSPYCPNCGAKMDLEE